MPLNRLLNGKAKCFCYYFIQIQPISQKCNLCLTARPMGQQIDGCTSLYRCQNSFKNHYSFLGSGLIGATIYVFIYRKRIFSSSSFSVYPSAQRLSRPMTISQGQGLSIRSRDSQSGPGTLNSGQGRSIRARDPPSGPGTLQ